MYDDQGAAVILDSKNFHRNPCFIITQKQHTIRLCLIAWRWLHESHTAMTDGEVNLCVRDAVLVGSREDPDAIP